MSADGFERLDLFKAAVERWCKDVPAARGSVVRYVGEILDARLAGWTQAERDKLADLIVCFISVALDVRIGMERRTK